MGRPHGDILSISHTRELAPGDRIHVVFLPGHLGFFKYGPEALFTVIKKTPTGEVTFKDQSGMSLGPLGGSREELLSQLRKRTDFKELSVIRSKTSADQKSLIKFNGTPEMSGVGDAPKILPPVVFIVSGVVVLALLAYWFSSKRDN